MRKSKDKSWHLPEVDPAKHIVVLAGEHSGDMHSAKLISELKALNPELTFSGLGGEMMVAQGMTLLGDRTDHVAMGLVGVASVIRHHAKLLFGVVRMIQRMRPAAVILVDSPDFNLRVASRIHGLGIPVYYYITPQVWAWRKGRIKQIKKFTDAAYCLFDFEKEMFDEAGVEAEWIGHPLVEIIANRQACDLRADMKLPADKKLVGLLPGSRKSEVRYLVPILAEVAEIIRRKRDDVEFVFSRAPGISGDFFAECMGGAGLRVIENRSQDIMAGSDAIIVASGTATLEAALLDAPMVVVYKTSFLCYYSLIKMMHIRDFALTNIVARRTVVPELLQHNCTPEKIAGEMLRLLEGDSIERMRKDLAEVRRHLGEPGATARAAASMLKRLDLAGTPRSPGSAWRQ